MSSQFREMGTRMGLAWQVSRDVTDLWGHAGDGMTVSNVLNKKKSLPLIYALENSPLSDKRALGNVYMKRVLQPEDVSQVMSILNQTGARPFAEARAQEIAQEALSGTGLCEEGLKPLRDLTDWALEGHGHD